jgi:excisionase family DNA binding protein
MGAEAVKISRLASQPEPTDEETLQAMLILMKRLIPRPTGAAAPATVVPTDAWLTPAAAAEYAAVSEDTLRAWISSGQLRAGRVGRVIRIRRSDVDALLAGQDASLNASAPKRAVEQDAGPVSDASKSILTSLRTRRRTKG